MKRPAATWPKGPTRWQRGETLYISVPFTWQLAAVREELVQGSWYWRRARVGGPAVDLMPEYLAGIPRVTAGGNEPNVLERVNPMATRTTLGCPRKCAFCGIGQGRIEAGGFRQLDQFAVRPIVCDNNFLAASPEHIGRVCAALASQYGWADFNQGLDARLMTAEKARTIASIGKPVCRLACRSCGSPAIRCHCTQNDRFRSPRRGRKRLAGGVSPRKGRS